jgi:hypothetical protein
VKVPALDPPPPRQLPTAEEVEAAFESLRRDGALPADRLSEPVLSLIGRRRVAAMCESDYDAAEALDGLALLVLAGPKRTPADRQLLLAMRHDQLRQRYESCKSLWAQRLAQTEEEHAERAAALREQHEQEVSEFKGRWQTAEFVKQFSHPSVRLLQMRHIEKKLALQKKWEEAKNAKPLADSQQKLEEAETQKALQGRMRADFQKLRERQRNEGQKLDEFYELLTSELVLKRQKNLEQFESAFRTLDFKQVSPGSKRLHLRKVTGDSRSCTTPRTVRTFAQYRNGRPASLNVEPMKGDIIFYSLLRQSS